MFDDYCGCSEQWKQERGTHNTNYKCCSLEVVLQKPQISFACVKHIVDSNDAISTTLFCLNLPEQLQSSQIFRNFLLQDWNSPRIRIISCYVYRCNVAKTILPEESCIPTVHSLVRHIISQSEHHISETAGETWLKFLHIKGSHYIFNFEKAGNEPCDVLLPLPPSCDN